MKKIGFLALVLLLLFLPCTSIFAENARKTGAEYTISADKFDARSLALMEADTGRVILAGNERASYSPASVTKIMTLLLVAEALDNGSISLDQKVIVSEYAASMGGSQVFLEVGEEMSVEELIKCTVIASANDAAVALAELVSGSESDFVDAMNRRAAELGMENSCFENVTGLDDDTEKHMTSALDIAIMSRELIKHSVILKYSSLWQDSIRDGEFTLTNTNRLVRYYDGCNGLKTGSTDKAGYCISVTAQRDGMTLIAVVMGAKSSNERNSIAKQMLDYGFANYGLYKCDEASVGNACVNFGVKDGVILYSSPESFLVEKSALGRIEKVLSIPESLTAPIVPYDSVGKVEYMLDGKKIGEGRVYSVEEIEKITFFKLYWRVICAVINK